MKPLKFKIVIPRPFKKVRKLFQPEDIAGKKSLEEMKHSLRKCLALFVFGASWQFVVNNNEWYHWVIFVLGTWSAMYGIDRTFKIRSERLAELDFQEILEELEKEEKQDESN
ncbi:Uncharacterized protein B5E38_5006 [Bacillus cereus]|nr:Uncharacterized protein B5E38_5006 [Bacillus cereus]ARO65092.1 Uncharacterized protein B5E39_2721 [Bacillus cereus]